MDEIVVNVENAVFDFSHTKKLARLKWAWAALTGGTYDTSPPGSRPNVTLDLNM